MKWFVLVMLVPFLAMGYESTDSLRLNNDLSKLKTKKKVKVADNLVKEGSILNALTFYESFSQDRPNNTYSVYQLGMLNYQLRDYKSAAQWFQKLSDMENSGYPKARYFYGLMLKYTGDYETAIDELTKSKEKYKEKDKDAFFKEVNRQIDGCKEAIASKEDPLKVKITHLDASVNSPFTEFAPRPFGTDKLVYSALKSDTAIIINFAKEKNYHSKIYTATVDADKISPGVLMGEPVNQTNVHTGNAVYGPDGKTLYFTQCEEGKGLQMFCEIYSSKKEGGSWAKPVKLPKSINDGSHTTHPYPVKLKDGKEYLFFTATRATGEGGSDIWFAEKTGDNSWSAAKNAGKKVNTAGSETTPYYDAENETLYFSSDGRPTFGGLDVFRSAGSPGNLGDAENIGYPLNSSVDDWYFILNGGGRDGYFVSNRPGVFSLKSETCCDDIWRFRYQKELYLKAYVTTRGDKQFTPLSGVDVKIDQKTDGRFEQHASLKTGADQYFYVLVDPEKEYRLNASKENYKSANETLTFTKAEAEKDTVERVFYLDPIIRRQIAVKRVYYQFDKATLTPDYKRILDSLHTILTEFPDFKIEIAGHTDGKGSEAYNMTLSLKRAQTAADYLLSKGIKKDRISLFHYGKSQPVAPNTKPDGSDDPDGRARNRRVEFKLKTDLKDIEINYDDNDPKGTK